jgi:glycosyltransferase involved in cell wall biosynthesis
MVKGFGLGGVERLLSESIPHLHRERFDYEFAYFTPWKDDVVPAFVDAGLPIQCLDIRSDTSLNAVAKVRRLLRQGEYDLVHTHSPLPSAIARVMASGAALVHTEHSLPGSRNRLTRLANRLTYPLCDVVISVSQIVEEAVASGWPTPRSTKVIHGGIDQSALAAVTEAEVSEARASLNIPPGDLVVGNVAHLRSQKGHDTWLETARAVISEVPNTTFVVVGREKETGYQDMLERRTAELGISEKVLFTGFKPDPYPFLAAFDVFLMASEFEGFPIALVEAMALGRPVVATDVGGVAEALGSEGSGLLAPPGDVQSLATHVVDLLEDGARRRELGARAQARARTEFSITRMVELVERTYDELLSDV